MHAKTGNGPKGSMTNQIIDPQMHSKPMFAPRILSAEQPSLIASLFENVRDVLFPQKLPPLKVTSRPVPVRDIWEKKDPKKVAAYSLTVHGLLIVLCWCLPTSARRRWSN